MKTSYRNWTAVNLKPVSAATLATLLASAALSGCGARAHDRVEGETHWLSSCTEGSICADGQTCVCGVCTSECNSDDACSDLPSAACAAPAYTPYQADCSAAQSQSEICVREVDVRPVIVDSGEPVTSPATSEPNSTVSEPSPSTALETTSERPTFTSTEPADASDAASSGCGDTGITAEESAATPRDNQTAELLAVLASAGVVATDEEYARAVRDHAAIVAVEPRVASFWTTLATPVVGTRVIVQFDASQGFETAAHCVNDAYGAIITDQAQIDESYFVFLELEGVFNLELVSQVYAAVPGVVQADPEVPAPPPAFVDNQAFVRGVTRDGETWTYAFGITRNECNIELAVATDAEGNAQIVDWQAEPDLPACQRGDGGS